MTASFKMIEYTIVRQSAANGSYTAKDRATYGENVTVTANPADGYEFDKILMNGKAITGTSFTMPASNVSLQVLFKENPAAIKPGWKTAGKNWYFYEEDGVKATGWKKVGTGWYLFNSGGVWIK